MLSDMITVRMKLVTRSTMPSKLVNKLLKNGSELVIMLYTLVNGLVISRAKFG